MNKCLLSLVILLGSFMPAYAHSNEPANTNSTAAEAALRLKKAHVSREWDECMNPVQNEERCKKLLSILWEREKAVLSKLSNHTKNKKVNLEVLAKQSSACYDPSLNYTALIKCWELLEERVQQALAGNILLVE